MKAKFKKFMAVMLSAMMVMTMCVTTQVRAEEETQKGDLTITSKEPMNGRKFEIYKLFNLTTDGSEDEKEAKFSYTEASKEATADVKKALKGMGKEANTVDEIVDVLSKLSADDIKVFAKKLHYSKFTAAKTDLDFSGKEFTRKGAEAVTSKIIPSIDYGYYVIIEKNNRAEDDKINNATISLAMLKNVFKKENKVNLKSDMPTVDKKIVEEGKEKTGTTSNVGGRVMFRLKGTAPRTAVLNTFEKDYEYTFIDTYSKGLSDPEISKIMINGHEVYNKETFEALPEDIVFTKQESGFTVKFDHLMNYNEFLKSVSDLDLNNVVVEYTAKLNENAVITEPEENDVQIQYSNNPNFDQRPQGDEENGNKPGKPEDDETGKTEIKKVYVHNFGLDITKVDGSTHKPLTGAEFVLYNKENRKEEGNFENAIAMQNVSTDGQYQLNAEAEASKENATLKVDAQGKLVVTGLGAGTYYLYETKAPKGYNLLKEPIEIVITCELKDDGTLLSKNCTIDGEGTNDTDGDGDFDFEVVNNSGTQLPETGGMGTTLIYAAGILAMAGGVCYFVMNKKRKTQR